jgi:hypothetical protein
MSTIQDVSVEQLAKVFYHYHEALSCDGNGHDSQEESFSWDRASHNQRKLMVAAARLALIELTTTPMESNRAERITPCQANRSGAPEHLHSKCLSVGSAKYSGRTPLRILYEFLSPFLRAELSNVVWESSVRSVPVRI